MEPLFFPSVIVFGEFIVLSAEFYCSVLKKFITDKYVRARQSTTGVKTVKLHFGCGN